MSLMVTGVLIAYACYRAYILVNLVNPSVSKKSFMRDLDKTEALRP